MAPPAVRPLLNAAMDRHFCDVATAVSRDGAVRFEGEGYRLVVLGAVCDGLFPRLEFVANAHLQHVGAFLARLLGRKGPARHDISLHFGHREMFSRWGPAYGTALSARGPEVLEVQGDDYVGLHVRQLRAILEGEVLPLTRRCVDPAAYDALINDDPEAPLPFLRATERATRGLAIRHLRGGADLAELAARYDRTLAAIAPPVRAEYDVVRRALLAGHDAR